MAISLPGMLLLGLVESSTGDAGSGGIIFIVMFILGIAYLVLFGYGKYLMLENWRGNLMN